MRKDRIFFLIMILSLAFTASGQSVGLVLSGGGAKGLSHIGVIKALEENDIPIDYICGTSMGAIVGGFYAIGLSPDQMVEIIKSPEYRTWYKGTGEREFYSYLYSGHPNSAMLNIDLNFKKNSIDSTMTPASKRKKYGVKVALPGSIVSPYPMDIAFIQIFSNAAAAAGYDFNKLMVPFFAVSSDIVRKKPFISDHGDLGSAIRASMSFPAYFTPVMIDSVLLFDGGMYDNFPWKIMEDKFAPDYIIGAKCVKGEQMNADIEDVYGQLELMTTTDTDYGVPEDKGIVISGIYDYSLLEFDKVDELVQSGYENALKYIEEIKVKVKRRRQGAEVDSIRIEFRKKCPNVQFNNVRVDGSLSDYQKDFIRKTFKNSDDVISMNDAKRSYFRQLSTNTVRTFYPTATIGEDSLFTLNLMTTPKNSMVLSVGGNISSSALMQGSLGLSHTHFAEHPWNTSINLDIGQFYNGLGLYFRQHIGVKPLFIYEVMFNMQKFDYFGSSQNILFENSLARNIQEHEIYATINAGTPISYKKSLLVEFGITGGRHYSSYFPTDGYSKYDKQHRTYFDYLTLHPKIFQSTFDYNLFPTSGRQAVLEARYTFGREFHKDGTMSEDNTMEVAPYKHVVSGRFYIWDYYNIAPWFSFGYNVELQASMNMDMCDYTSTMLMLPAYKPTFHSRTLLLDKYRAPIYLGVAIAPIFKFSETFYLHITAGYVQPYRQLKRLSDGMYEYDKPFQRGSFLGNAALVWQSPIGPISLSCAYYDRTPGTKWYPSFNIGFLIFRPHGLRN